MIYPRLYRQFQPSNYILNVNLEREARYFSGKVAIHGHASNNGEIILHSHELTIKTALVDGQPVKFELGKQDSLTLTSESIKPGEHIIEVEFEGNITDSMVGLYPCYSENTEELLATQFESHHAREVFPCIDEPEAKATFDLTLRHEPGVTVLGNTPVRDQRDEGGQTVTSFETTPRMSTYLLAWVTGKLDYREGTTKDGVVVRAYAPSGKGHQLNYAISEAVKCLELINDYFGVPYPLAKCDLVALPDFSCGAMENWGCITFRESVLLADEHTSTYARQYISMVITHELAHQWFGNLVTMRWWNDLWLNESFANWMEYFVASKLHPEWEMMTQYFADEATLAFERDSLASVQRIQQEVHSPEEIPALFDPAIVYAKGGNLLNMLHAHIGDVAFREGLRRYFLRHKYGNTEGSDLWQAMSETSNQDVGALMTPWISQSGLPVVTVGSSGKTANISQRRFFGNPRQAVRNDQSLWPIPLLSGGQLDSDMLNTRSASLTIKDSTRPLLLNQDRTGYYLALYDKSHLAELANMVENGQLPLIDRLGLLNDCLSLSKAGLLPFEQALKLMLSYRHESSEPIWGAITNYISALKMFADDDEELLAGLRSFITNIASEQYRRLGLSPVEGEPYFDQLLRPTIIAHMAYAQDSEVTSKLLEMFNQAAKPEDIMGDLRPIVFGVAVKKQGEAAYDKLLAWHKSNTSAEIRDQITAGLAAAHRPELIERSLELLTTSDVKSQDLPGWIRHLVRNRHARDLTWQWVQDNWGFIVSRFKSDVHYADFAKHTSNALTKPEQLASYKEFFEPKMHEAGLNRAITLGIEGIEARAEWIKRDSDHIVSFLKNQPSLASYSHPKTKCPNSS